MRWLIATLMLVALMASPIAAQTQTVLCGLVRSHNPATATTQGQFTLLNTSGSTPVVVPAGQTFNGTNWTCVAATPRPPTAGSGSRHTFVAVVSAGAPGHQGPPPTLVACGTAEPVPGPLNEVVIGLRTSSGLMLFDVPADQRSPGYQCVRYLPAPAGQDANYFVGFARPGDPGFVPQQRGPAGSAPVRTLPSTSTAPHASTPALSAVALAALLALLSGALWRRRRGYRVVNARGVLL